MDKYRHQAELEGDKISLDGWIGMGDTYRLNKNIPKAKETYNKAYELTESFRLNGNKNPSLTTKSLYSSMQLEIIDGQGLSKQRKNDYIEQFGELETNVKDPTAKFLILFSFVALEEWGKAEAIYKKVAPICKGFADYPILARFKQQ